MPLAAVFLGAGTVPCRWTGLLRGFRSAKKEECLVAAQFFLLSGVYAGVCVFPTWGFTFLSFWVLPLL